MARTKQIVRKSTGGCPPRSRVAIPKTRGRLVDRGVAMRYEAALNEAQRMYRDVERPADVAREVTTTNLSSHTDRV